MPDWSSRAIEAGCRSAELGGLDVGATDLRREPTAQVAVLDSATALTGAEEQGRPPFLEGARCADRTDVGGRALRAGDRVLRHEGLGEAVPGERRDDRVHPVVQAGGQDGGGSPVRGAGEADHRIGAGLGHLGSFDGEVDQAPGVGTLVRRVVEVDAAAGLPESPGGVGDHGVAVAGQRASDVGAVGLAAAEAVGQHDRRSCGTRVGGQDRGVQRDGLTVRLCLGRHLEAGLDHRLVLGRRGRCSRKHEPQREGEHPPRPQLHATSLPRSTIRAGDRSTFRSCRGSSAKITRSAGTPSRRLSGRPSQRRARHEPPPRA